MSIFLYFQKSIDSGIMPTDWTHGKVVWKRGKVVTVIIHGFKWLNQLKYTSNNIQPSWLQDWHISI